MQATADRAQQAGEAVGAAQGVSSVTSTPQQRPPTPADAKECTADSSQGTPVHSMLCQSDSSSDLLEALSSPSSVAPLVMSTVQAGSGTPGPVMSMSATLSMLRSQTASERPSAQVWQTL